MQKGNPRNEDNSMRDLTEQLMDVLEVVNFILISAWQWATIKANCNSVPVQPTSSCYFATTTTATTTTAATTFSPNRARNLISPGW